MSDLRYCIHFMQILHTIFIQLPQHAGPNIPGTLNEKGKSVASTYSLNLAMLR